MRPAVDLSGRPGALTFAAALTVSLAAASGLAGWLTHRPAFRLPDVLWLAYAWYPAVWALGRGAYADGDTLQINRPFSAPVSLPWTSVVAAHSMGVGPYWWRVRAAA